MLVFPLIVWLGAGGKTEGKKASKICKFFGDISYPIYITHFPLVCIYYAWIKYDFENLKRRNSIR
jgi:peptidoglycan/LPS O-acetylase OafA/YrhL